MKIIINQEMAAKQATFTYSDNHIASTKQSSTIHNKW